MNTSIAPKLGLQNITSKFCNGFKYNVNCISVEYELHFLQFFGSEPVIIAIVVYLDPIFYVFKFMLFLVHLSLSFITFFGSSRQF